jgi:hypothetical protein
MKNMTAYLRISGNPKAWYERKVGLIALALLCGVLISVPVGLYLISRMSQAKVLTSFTCYPKLGNNNGTFVISVDINSVDKMSQDEAILVAKTVLSKVLFNETPEMLAQEPILNLRANATIGDDGNWSVRFDWDTNFSPEAQRYGNQYFTIVHGLHFYVSIDSSKRTITYG